MASTKTLQVSSNEISDRAGTISTLGAPQPAFIKNLTNRFKNPSVANSTRLSSVPADAQRAGDILAEDLFPDSIRSLHIHDLSADKLTAGTINTDEITISSEDGSVTIIGNLISIDNAGGIRQVTVGNYNTTKYGIAFGNNPNSPDLEITGSLMYINTVGFVAFRSGSDATFSNSGNTLTSTIGYVINQFVIQGDSTNGLNLAGNITVGETAGDYGGGSKVLFMANASVAPTSDPTGGSILYMSSGSLKMRGSGGVHAVIAEANVKSITSSDSPYSTAAADLHIMADASSAAVTVTLPLASTNEGRRIHVKKIDATANAVTVSRASSDDIEGVTSVALATQFESITLFSAGGARWFVESLT